VVDPISAPVAGAEVTVKCLTGKAKPIRVSADSEGYARFWIDADKDYSIEAKSPGFKTKRLKRVHVSKPSESSRTQSVEFRMELSGPMTTVY
jgi:Carboxypeptidase regulatory-like domain